MTQLMCPVCKTKLLLQEKTWRCEQGHSYDQAKQGYVNLHVVQHKNSKTPGDTPESVAARRRFLATEAYQALQQKIVDVIADLRSVVRAMDIGCGEGYYTQAMASQIPHLIAVDIAKNAVQIAAKQDVSKAVTWVVGTGTVLPATDNSLQLCTSFFSPLPKAEMLRTLEQGSYLLMATPAAQHLLSMREALFDEVKPHEPEKFIAQLQPEFELVEQYQVEQALVLDQQQLQDLIAMTPYAYKAKADKRAALEQHSEFNVSACFKLYLFVKK